MFGKLRFSLPQLLVFTAIALLTCFMGLIVPIYASIFGESLARLTALPALLALGLLLILSRKLLFLFILCFRASADTFFESTKFSLGGYGIGVGGLVNAFVILVVLLLVIERPSVVPKKVLTMWLGFLLMMFIGVVLSPERADAVRLFLLLLSYFAVFVGAFYVIQSGDDFRSAVRIILWSSLVPAAYAMFELANLAGRTGFGSLRLYGTFTHPNIFAFYLTVVISLTFYMLKSSFVTLSSGRRVLLTAYMVLLLGLLLLTQTRSAWAACFAIFAVYGIFFERRYLVYLGLATMLVLLIPSVQDRLLDLGQGNDEYVMYARLNSFAWRRFIWETSLQWMQPSHYLLGYGVESFKHFAPTFFPLSGGVNWAAHSVYVQLFFEVGAVGLAAFIWLFGRFLWLSRLMLPIDKLGGFISISLVVQYLITSFSDNMLSYLAFNWYFFFIIGSACAVVMAERKPQPERSDHESLPAHVRSVEKVTPA